MNQETCVEGEDEVCEAGGFTNCDGMYSDADGVPGAYDPSVECLETESILQLDASRQRRDVRIKISDTSKYNMTVSSGS